jgi:hypothetical protein
MEIFIPPCSSNDQISKDIYSFLYKQGNYIPISLKKSKNNNNSQSGGGSFYDNFSRFMDGITYSSNKQKNNEELSSSSTEIKNNEELSSSSSTEIKNDDVVTSSSSSSLLSDNSVFLDFIVCNKENNEKCTNKKYTLENLKGTKLYFLISRNGECARWV